MHDAVRNGEFSLHYQPQFHAGRRTLAGVEALMRWERPGQGFVSPVEFIPLAEENGLINYLGAWALRAACHQTMRWHQQGLQGLTVSVNVSPKQFHQGNFSDLILQALQESGLPPQYLLLEITESILMHEPARTRAVLDKLRGRGVEFAVDDFGTGYSSLGYLKRFPLTALKIDRSFVRDIASDPNDRAIVGAVLGLARELNLYSVAEGVETEEQMRFLSAKGCDFIQGYLLGRPVPPAEILQRVNSGEWTVAGKVAG
jgi:EAL domain-containing protein (putative c-di-GMP-specific phosphodiesterase class I)